MCVCRKCPFGGGGGAGENVKSEPTPEPEDSDEEVEMDDESAESDVELDMEGRCFFSFNIINNLIFYVIVNVKKDILCV